MTPASCPHCLTLFRISGSIPTLPDVALLACPHCMVTIIAAFGEDGRLRRGVFIRDGGRRAVA